MKKTKSQPPKEDPTRKAYNSLRKMLFFNELAVGQRINYGDISKRLGMSPTPVIQALKWLEFQGLIRHENNRGFYLEEPNYNEVEEIYHLRAAIELTLLERSVSRLDEAGIALLEKSWNAFWETRNEKSVKQKLVKDMEFHMTLASLSGGRPGCLILQQIFDLLFLKYQAALLYLQPNFERHKKIFDCVVARDLEGARELLSKHCSDTSRGVLEAIRNNLKERESIEFA